ncbi:LIM domain containing protein [Histomonas meleagridis]|uniref:LIM domain containing protein n=1 Tax=Histomonas meleagridis TaxID=135588 RepID=UPI00355AC98B|nr:LIM domain containing protein [Histomonas meleagridis]KAH0797855.1 LIM domain containing protein [Histomonas meleagridis]
MSDLPPPPMSGGLPPPPMSGGLPPPPMSGGLPPPPMSGGLPPPPMSGGLPPPPMSGGLPPPPMSGGLPPPPMSGGLPPPPMSGGLPPPPMSGGLPPPPMSGGLPPPPSSGGLPPPPMSGGLPPPPSSSGLPAPPTSTGLPPLSTGVYTPSKKISAFGGNTRIQDAGPEPTLLRTCAACQQRITETFYVTCGDYYHQNCLKCSHCQTPLKPPTCAMFRGELLCMRCANYHGELRKCQVCDQYLYDIEERIKPPGFEHAIHATCFACYECNGELDQDSFKMIGGFPICPRCAPAVEKRKCHACGNAVVGRYVKNRGRYFHVDHFVCSQCECVLYGRNFIIHHDKYFCPKDGQHYLRRCSYCKNEFDGMEQDLVTWHKKVYHGRCFVCRICGTRCDVDNAKCFHGRPHCDDCYKKRVEEEEVNNHKHRPEESEERRNKFKSYFDKKNFVFPRYAKDIQDDEIESTIEEKEKSKSGHKHHRHHKHSSDDEEANDIEEVSEKSGSDSNRTSDSDDSEQISNISSVASSSYESD